MFTKEFIEELTFFVVLIFVGAVELSVLTITFLTHSVYLACFDLSETIRHLQGGISNDASPLGPVEGPFSEEIEKTSTQQDANPRPLIRRHELYH